MLNGLFGVEKSTTLPSGKKVLRLIMNLVPSNEILIQLQGTVAGLPTITSWQSTVLEGEEELRMFHMSSAFYLIRLPDAWRRYLAFNLHAMGCDIGAAKEDAGRDLPMGWISSVSVMQEVSENLLLTGGLDPTGQIRRTKGLPKFMTEVSTQARGEKRVWWHVYLDNFAAAERLVPPEPARQGQICHQSADEIWAKAGVVSSKKKRISNSSRVEELGAEIEGEGKTVGGSTLRFVIRSTLWLVKQKYLVKKWVQIVAGHWIFLMQFRRPTMSLFNGVWTFVSSTKQASPSLVMKVRQELMHAVLISPLTRCFLGAIVTDRITASDASQVGGADKISQPRSEYRKNKLEPFRCVSSAYLMGLEEPSELMMWLRGAR